MPNHAVLHQQNDGKGERFGDGSRGPAGEAVLVLWSSDASLRSPVVSWARYGAEDQDLEWLVAHQAGTEEEPPYPSVVSALADGWHLVQLDGPPAFGPGAELRTGHLPYQAVLRREVGRSGNGD
jgi:hypothetical protein